MAQGLEASKARRRRRRKNFTSFGQPTRLITCVACPSMIPRNLPIQLKNLSTGQTDNQTSRAFPKFRLLQPDLCGRVEAASLRLRSITCSKFQSSLIAMTWTSYSFTAKSSTTHLLKYRSVALPTSPMNSISTFANCDRGLGLCRPCWCSFHVHKPPRHGSCNYHSSAFYILKAQGIHLQALESMLW